jgi:hypothetical protein
MAMKPNHEMIEACVDALVTLETEMDERGCCVRAESGELFWCRSRDRWRVCMQVDGANRPVMEADVTLAERLSLVQRFLPTLVRNALAARVDFDKELRTTIDMIEAERTNLRSAP